MRKKEPSEAPGIALKEQNSISGESNLMNQEESNNPTTNNKNTNNKTIKTLTNRMNAESVIVLGDYLDELAELINDLRVAETNAERELYIDNIFKLLVGCVPRFKEFKKSQKDVELIAQMEQDGPYSYTLADKILSNAQAVIDGKKESRFGDLFVGVDQMILQYNLNYG